MHFGHRLMTRLRGFGEDVSAHDEHIVNKWNSVITPDDEVWILGDLTLKHPNQIADLFYRLNGRKKIVLGNHDKAHPLNRGYEKVFEDTLHMFSYMGTSASIRVDGTMILMSHFPYSGDHTREDRHNQWRLNDEGLFLLHGHTHKEERQESDHMLHVGWDSWGRPVSESEVMRYFYDWRESEA